jgi:hypothetical protein
VRSETKPLSNVKINLEGSKLTSVWTDANGNYTFSDLQAGGTYIITPIVSRSFKPSSRTFNDLRRNESADFFGQDDATPTPTPTPTPKHECSETDQIKTLRSFEPSWRRQIQGEQTKIMAENVPKNIEKAEASLGHIEFQYSFPQPCKAAVVMATYEWRISWPANPVSPGKSKSVRKEKSFFCGKLLGFWGCR